MDGGMWVLPRASALVVTPERHGRDVELDGHWHVL